MSPGNSPLLAVSGAALLTILLGIGRCSPACAIEVILGDPRMHHWNGRLMIAVEFRTADFFSTTSDSNKQAY